MQSLFTLMGNHVHAMPIKRGEVSSSLLSFDFADEPVPHEAFKPFVRDLKFDVGELAIVTLLQALAYDKQLVLLPLVISARFHHSSLGYPVSKGHLTPKDLEGRVVAVRTFSQTTGVWVRSILQHQFDVDLKKITFMTFDESHLAEFKDPPNCILPPKGRKLDDMLLAGEVDAGIPIALASTLMSDKRLATIVPDPKASADDWYAVNQAAPINHMLVVRKSLAQSRPDLVREVYRMFRAGRDALPATPTGQIDMLPYGINKTKRSLELVIGYAHEQGVIPRRFSVDEVYADAIKILGDEAF
jgi:4,5-dihydroxyphthalate decarboxylase